MDHDPEHDEWLERLLDRALEGFEQLLDPAELQAVRSRMRDDLRFSPEGQRRLRAARPDPTVERSTEVDRGATDGRADMRKKLKGA